MHGWITVATIAGAQLLLAVYLMWRVSARWWHYFLILLLTLPFLRLSLLYTGDVGHHFPPGSFSDGAEGKDQIILASAASTVLQALMMAACAFGVLGWCWGRFKNG